MAVLAVDRYRERLMALERELVSKIGREVEAARTSSEDQPDPADQAVVDELRDEYFILASTDTEILANVRAALRRIDEGTYGRCLADGGPIEEKRLEAVPWTAYCAKHQREAEEAAGVRTPRL